MILLRIDVSEKQKEEQRLRKMIEDEMRKVGENQNQDFVCMHVEFHFLVFVFVNII